jgi:type IV secretory pathway VirB4 component
MPNNTTSQTTSTQNSLLISEVKDGVVIMKDGSLRAVVLASAINFDLMSSQEQNAVEFSYQGFLNSLHFPIQIVIKSQRIDLDRYIEKLSKLRDSQPNPLLSALMEDYIANITGLIEEVNIMDKRFYVVVPFFPPMTLTKTSLVSGVSNIFKPTPLITVSSVDFENYKSELRQRVQQVTNGLNQMGIRAIALNTQELIDLYYTSYNPDVASSQKLIDAAQFQGPSVTRGGPPTVPPAPTSVASQPMPPAQTPGPSNPLEQPPRGPQ